MIDTCFLHRGAYRPQRERKVVVDALFAINPNIHRLIWGDLSESPASHSSQRELPRVAVTSFHLSFSSQSNSLIWVHCLLLSYKIMPCHFKGFPCKFHFKYVTTLKLLGVALREQDLSTHTNYCVTMIKLLLSGHQFPHQK